MFLALWVAVSVQAADNTKLAIQAGAPILFDTDDPPPDYPIVNPYAVLVSINSWTKSVHDHEGKPHEAGHLVQIIMDGGNGVQDPPRADGMPGGDDSLAYGNFNMLRVAPPEAAPDESGRKGMFYSQRYFIPYVAPVRAYYLRIWEGDNVATAPYYQNSSEYDAGDDRGGGMIFLRTGEPMDTDWTFGPSKPRPPAEKSGG